MTDNDDSRDDPNRPRDDRPADERGQGQPGGQNQPGGHDRHGGQGQPAGQGGHGQPDGQGGQPTQGRQPTPEGGVRQAQGGGGQPGGHAGAQPRQGATRQADQGLVERYGKSFGVILAALFVTSLVPIVNLVRFVPLFKEIVLGAAVVLAFTAISDSTEGAKHALIAGMAAAVVFNVINIPLQVVLGGLAWGGGSLGSAGAGTTTAGEAAAMGGMFGGLGALTNLIGLIFFSPFGYAIGGLIGAAVND